MEGDHLWWENIKMDLQDGCGALTGLMWLMTWTVWSFFWGWDPLDRNTACFSLLIKGYIMTTKYNTIEHEWVCRPLGAN
jgi:hypothetical protein